jgi:hypothetical protein
VYNVLVQRSNLFLFLSLFIFIFLFLKKFYTSYTYYTKGKNQGFGEGRTGVEGITPDHPGSSGREGPKNCPFEFIEVRSYLSRFAHTYRGSLIFIEVHSSLSRSCTMYLYRGPTFFYFFLFFIFIFLFLKKFYTSYTYYAKGEIQGFGEGRVGVEGTTPRPPRFFRARGGEKLFVRVYQGSFEVIEVRIIPVPFPIIIAFVWVTFLQLQQVNVRNGEVGGWWAHTEC